MRSYDSAPHIVSLSQSFSLPVCRRSSLLTGEWGGEGGGEAGMKPNHATERKFGPLEIVQASLLPPFEMGRTNTTCPIRLSGPLCSRHNELISM